MNLQELLLSYFSELEPDIKEIVSDVYALEREYSDFYENPRNIKTKIKDVIERVADFRANHQEV
jgi:hypothetical protein